MRMIAGAHLADDRPVDAKAIIMENYELVAIRIEVTEVFVRKDGQLTSTRKVELDARLERRSPK